MDFYPAIDIRGGWCVRLHQGDYERETVYGEDPVGRAMEFVAGGASRIHVVDLDAARTGEPVNREVIAAIANAVDVPVQAGGGVRSVGAAEALFDAGVTRVVIGTAALSDPDLVAIVARDHPVAVGLDARAEEVATDGWTRGSGRSVLEVARGFADVGVEALVVTDIDRDGTLGGPDLSGLSEVLAATDLDVIASGGVSSLEDLHDLARIDVDGRVLAGVIVGKAIYEGRIDVAEAVATLAGDMG